MGLILVFALITILIAEFVNGWTDAPNAIATVVSTKVLSPTKAVILATVLNTLGAMAGTAVATTIGKGIVDSSAINPITICAAMLSIIFWSAIAARKGIPTSESHALIAGLAGATLATAGPEALLWMGWQKVLIGLLFSTFLGFGGGIAIGKIVQKGFAASAPTKANKIFSSLQIVSAMFMAFNHGSNDGQKFIGVFTMTLVIGGVLSEFTIPFWVILLCSVTMGVGTSVGGWKIIRKTGMQMVKLTPWQGFSAESAASSTIMLASQFGIPLSTTHTINTAIMGVGASRRMSAVKWSDAGDIALAWILTFPICGSVAFVSALIMQKIF